MLKKAAVILAGCGNQDGAEVTETVGTLIALSQFKVEYQCFAPDLNFEPKNFITKQNLPEKRNVLVEAARLTRGQIQSTQNLKVDEFDALVLPGGFGVAVNLCSWALAGASCEVLPEIEKVILDFYASQKPIGAICIAPCLVARVLGNHHITVTVGSDAKAMAEVRRTGAFAVECAVQDYVADRDHKILSSPAYMLPATPFDVFKGVNGMIKELAEMA